jgi:hypothetical protein
LADVESSKLEGITLNVYLYVVRQGKPVGPREVMKGAKLSSPSVAYRHLQKLEDLAVLAKNEYGEYVVKQKVNARGYIWIGKLFLPKMLLYAVVFAGILTAELLVLLWHWAVEDVEFKIFFGLLMAVTGVALGLFVFEGVMQHRRLKRNFIVDQKDKTSED